MRLITLGRKLPIVVTTVAVGALASVSFALANDTSEQEPQAPAVSIEENVNSTVTIEDVNSAVRSARECIESEGITVVYENGRGMRPSRYTFTIPPAGGSLEAGPDPEVMARARDCEVESLDVRKSYELQKGLPSASDVHAAIDKFEACIAGGGRSDIPTPDSFGQADYGTNRSVSIQVDQGEAAAQCAVAMEEETGLLAPRLIFIE